MYISDGWIYLERLLLSLFVPFFIFSKINNLNTCKAHDARDDACYTYNECLLYIIDEQNNSQQSNYHFLSQDEALSFRQLKYVWKVTQIWLKGNQNMTER